MRDGGLGVWLAIALGSAAGGVLRHALTEAVVRVVGGGFPWGTLLVNVVGSAAMGVAAALAGGPVPWPPAWRHAVMTGLLGGFTTFSAFSIQTVTLAEQGAWPAAAANVAVSVLTCVAACWAAFAAATALAR